MVFIKFKKEPDHFLFKFGQEKFIRDAFKNGNLYFNTIQNLRKNSNKSIGDENENKDFIFSNNDSSLKITLSQSEGHLCTKETGFIDATIDLSVADKKYPITHVFCTSLTEAKNIDIKNRLISFPDEMIDFGTYSILIFNPEVFLNRVIQSVEKHNNINQIYFGRVKYEDFSKNSQEIGAFKKNKSYQIQNEYRIALVCNSEKPVIINIGSMEDIAIFCKPVASS